MKNLFLIFTILIFLLVHNVLGQSSIRPWQKIEITFEAQNEYENPYTDVEVWIHLTGPGFDKRCYGFWDGESIWKVRLMATEAGTWHWESGSNQSDEGLNGKKGTFKARAWSDSEKDENPLRRGMIKATKNGHAFEFNDGTPMFWLADTWWPCMTQRYPWYDDDMRTVGSKEAGFKDYVRFRKNQGYNGCMVIAAFPNWTTREDGWWGGRWEDEEGNNAFFIENNKPDLDRLNPAYFRSMDKKVDYLNENGFIPFIETARRDIAAYWKANYEWPDSYARYMRYIYFRYQGNIIINSPIHLDAMALTGGEWNRAANIAIDRYDWPPFGHLASANPPGSTLHTFGHTDEARWLSFHSVGNERDHTLFPDITEMFYLDRPVPCLHNEPYYDGLKWGNDADHGSELAAYYSRVAIYGSVLSGGLAGHVYGADHVWDGDDEMPESFFFKSASQMEHIYTFLFSEGSKYQDLMPIREKLEPNRTENKDKNMGWAYCMGTESKELFLMYFEKGCPITSLIETIPEANYLIQWFDTASGNWIKDEELKSDKNGTLIIPMFPDNTTKSTRDWAVKLKRKISN